MSSYDSSQLLLFAQSVEVADKSGIPLTQGLDQMATNFGGGKASQWAGQISSRLKSGSSIAESVKDLRGFDPLLSSLISVNEGRGLADLLVGYSNYLVLFAGVSEKVNTTILYPVILSWLAVLNLLLLNFMVFPQVLFEQGYSLGTTPLLIQMLSFSAPATWPISLPLPALIVFTALNGIYTLVFASYRVLPYTLLGRLTGLEKMARNEHIGRQQSTLALVLEAGVPLEKALLIADLQCSAGGEVTSLELVSKLLSEGTGSDEALRFSAATRPLLEAWPENGDSLILARQLRNYAYGNLSQAESLVWRFERVFQLAAYLLIGFVVLAVASSLFGSYYHYALTGGF